MGEGKKTPLTGHEPSIHGLFAYIKWGVRGKNRKEKVYKAWTVPPSYVFVDGKYAHWKTKTNFSCVFCVIVSLFINFFVYLQQKNIYYMSNNQQNMMLNRLKAALAEQGKTNRWLSEQLGKSENTISRWCANKVQPSITQLNEMAAILDVDIRTLINPTRE